MDSSELLSKSGAEFLAGLYQPPLGRFPDPVKKGHSHQWAKAAAWGEALKEWLAGYKNEKTRRDYLQALAQLLNFCHKLPWEVCQADVVEWLEVSLSGKASRTQKNMLQRVSRFYRFTCEQTWRSPAGRHLRLCRINPLEDIELPKAAKYKRVVALSEAELERLQAAFDLETPYGRRDQALFTVMLETGMHLREVLRLQLRDIAPADRTERADGEIEPFRGQKAAWEAVRAYLELDSHLAGMRPEDYVFTPLMDVAGAMAKRNPLDWERQPLGEHTARAAFKEYVRWAGLDPEAVRPETLRYSGARRLLETGASMQDVAAFLRINYVWRTRQIMNHLQGSAAPRSKRRAAAKTRQRRRLGAQPGNRNNLKHGKWSQRFRLRHLGVPWGSVREVTPESAPWVIAELRAMEDELFALEPGTFDAQVKRLVKMSHIAVTIGRVMWVWFGQRGKAEEEERSS
jgi:site-specific recombinase XerD